MLCVLLKIIYYYWLTCLSLLIYSVLTAIFDINLRPGRLYVWALVKISRWIADRNRKPLKRVASMVKSNSKSLTKPGGVNSLFGKEESKFTLSDVMDFCRNGIEAIVDDEVVQRFHAPELPMWNLLTRNSMVYKDDLSLQTRIFWFIGLLIRYLILLPYRLAVFFIGLFFLVVSFSIIYLIPPSRFHDFVSNNAHRIVFYLFSSSLSAVVTFHDKQNRPKEGICVANHTSPLDVVFLSLDCCYLLTAQRQRGPFGMVQNLLKMGANHIWFDRSSASDRTIVMDILRDHISKDNSWPILMFPEGTCINNTSVMMFRKGSFEIGCVVYPVAIKYWHMFADSFWNSGKETFTSHVFRILTSWCVVADIWYLPPCVRKDDESTMEFANRLKQMIASRSQLEDMEWDGQLKRKLVNSNLKEQVMGHYSEYLKQELQ